MLANNPDVSVSFQSCESARQVDIAYRQAPAVTIKPILDRSGDLPFGHSAVARLKHVEDSLLMDTQSP